MKYKIQRAKFDSFLNTLQDFTDTVKSREGSNVLGYNVFQGADKYSFVHYMTYASHEAEQKHLSSGYVRRFNKKILDNADGEPVYIELNTYGQAQGLVPDVHREEAQQQADTNLYRTESELSVLNKQA